MATEPILDSRELFAFAHDLRTHLRTVLTRVQLVQRNGGQQLPPEDQSLLHEAADAAGAIQGLLNAVMAFSEAGTRSEAQMKLSLLLRGVLMERKAAIADAGAEVELSNNLDIAVPVELQ